MAAIQDVDEVTFVKEPLDIHHKCLVCLQLLREPALDIYRVLWTSPLQTMYCQTHSRQKGVSTL